MKYKIDYFIIKSPKDLTPNRFIKELKTSDMKIDIYEYSIGNTEEISSKLRKTQYRKFASYIRRLRKKLRVTLKDGCK